MLGHWCELHFFVRYSILRIQLHSHNILQYFNFPESEISDPKSLVYHRNIHKPWGFPLTWWTSLRWRKLLHSEQEQTSLFLTSTQRKWRVKSNESNSCKPDLGTRNWKKKKKNLKWVKLHHPIETMLLKNQIRAFRMTVSLLEIRCVGFV